MFPLRVRLKIRCLRVSRTTVFLLQNVDTETILME